MGDDAIQVKYLETTFERFILSSKVTAVLLTESKNFSVSIYLGIYEANVYQYDERYY